MSASPRNASGITLGLLASLIKIQVLNVLDLEVQLTFQLFANYIW
jgi:hypothetical protein